MTTALIIGFFCCTCFPIWPRFLQVFVWYMAVSFLLVVFGTILLRAMIFLFVWMLGYEFWILPNLFDEEANVADSFKPLFSFEPTKPGQLPYRIGVFVAFFSFCYWAITQPSEFDGFVKGQGDFLKDLYAGTLLSDMSQADKENIDKPKMQSLDEILKSLEDDEPNMPLKDHLNLEDEDQLDSMLDNLVNSEEDVDEDEE
jgi:translocation protein SEC62